MFDPDIILLARPQTSHFCCQVTGLAPMKDSGCLPAYPEMHVATSPRHQQQLPGKNPQEPCSGPVALSLKLGFQMLQQQGRLSSPLASSLPHGTKGLRVTVKRCQQLDFML